jgi:D-alanyl-D-alanine carboxypeptidase
MRARRLIFATLLAVVLVVSAVMCTSCGSPSFNKEVQSRLNAAFDKGFSAAGTPGMVVGVWVDGKGGWIRSNGKANTQTGDLMNPGDGFRIASITKTFTGTLVLQLIDEGRLTLDDTIDKYVSGIPDGDKITMRMLLNHTSGLFDCDNAPGLDETILADPLKQWTPQEMVDLGIKYPPYFPPGQGYHYSNTDSILLGMVIEKVTGKKVEALFKTRMFDKLGLNNTYFPTGPNMPSPHAHGYFEVDGKMKDVTVMNMSWDWTAGAVISNLNDLKTWVKELGEPKLISERMQKERLKIVGVKQGSGGVTTGYGLHISKVNEYLGHTGADYGWTSLAYRWPEKGVTVVILMNTLDEKTLGQISPLFANLANAVEPSSFPGFSQ